MAAAASRNDLYRVLSTGVDAAFYREAYDDLREAELDPVAHYAHDGWREGRDPAAWFSTKAYLAANADVAASGVNPFYHYLAEGCVEGRGFERSDLADYHLFQRAGQGGWRYELARPAAFREPPVDSEAEGLGFRYDIVAGLKPMERRLAEAGRAAAAVRPDPAARLEEALAEAKGPDLHLTVSHDDYSANIGGVQLCLQREGARIAQIGRNHLHLFPAAAWPMVRDRPPATVGVLWNGRRIGHFAPEEVAEAARRRFGGRTAGARSVAIHSLLGHSVEVVLAAAEAVGASSGYFWIHDFASLCDGHHLMRNDVADCGAPPPDSAACSLCVYGPRRRAQIAAHERLFDALDLTAVAPSETALETWLKGWRFRVSGTRVLPHASLVPRRDTSPAKAPGPFRFAFVGVPAAYKGWPIFAQLARRFADDPRYAFLHLAKTATPDVPVEHRAVAVTEDRPYAMREALEGLGVDAAMVWSLCRETFSFAAYEAAAAGAAVVTCADSGNVARFVRSGGHGLVLETEGELLDMFETGAILDLARDRRGARLYDLAFSALTVDLLTEGAR
ncbi:MAG: hypothetical protein ACK41C_08105 [Phenylobacterium sp.]|uniref:hypothetical protein n=1 Tax=Phenylobacterium sp. TaxID=1871053 RepID=UPI00391C1EF8